MPIIPGVPDDVVDKVAGLITAGRSCVIGIVNQTQSVLIWDSANTTTEHGQLLSAPARIGAGATEAAAAQSGENSAGSGCEGVIAYTGHDTHGAFTVLLHFDHSHAGTNSADASVSSDGYACDAWAGPGVSKAPIRFVLRTVA